MNNVLRCLNLHKTFWSGTEQELHVLKGIDLKVRKGELLSIVGPSGAGKSTLLHLLGGLDEPNKGSVFIGEEDIFRINRDRRARLRLKKIGFVFQFYHLLPEFSVLENVIFPAYIARTLSRQKLSIRATSLLKEVGLANRLSHKPSELSGGEAQRVAIARSLILEPEIILCDEPTGNLDSETGARILELLTRINKEKKKTFVIVTHDEAIAKRAERIIHIKDGLIE